MMGGTVQGGAGTAPGHAIRLAAFLGNPGREYEQTRHNVGWMVATEWEAGRDLQWKAKFGGRVAQSGGIALVKPGGFMNRSGPPIQQALRFFDHSVTRLVVVHDDLETAFGRVLLAWAGGDRGHNGLRSVSQHLGTRDYWRLRIGIGRPPGRRDPATWVLAPFDKTERESLPFILAAAAELLDLAAKRPEPGVRDVRLQ